MSEQQNIETVQAMYAAFGRGDIQFILDHLTGDIVWTLEGPASVPFSGERHGKAEVLGFFEALAATQTNQKLTTDRWVAQGGTVASTGRYGATVTATGKSYDSAQAHFFTFRDGKVSRFDDYVDTALVAEAYRESSAVTTA